MKSIKTIATLGIVTVFLLLLMMMFTLQQSPHLKQLLQLSQDIQAAYELKEVIVSKRLTKEGQVYRVVFQTHNQLTAEQTQKLAHKMGEYLWRNYSPLIRPDQVVVQEMGASKNQTFQVAPPAKHKDFYYGK